MRITPQETEITAADDSFMVLSRLRVEEDAQWQGYVFEVAYDRRGTLRGFNVDAHERPLDVESFHRVPLGRLDRAARAAAARKLEEWDDAECGEDETIAYLRVALPEARDWIDSIADPVRKGDRELAQICQRYRELEGDSDWKDKLESEFHKGGIATVISRARRRGFLTPTAKGQYGGELTAKSLRLLVAPENRETLERLITQLRETEFAISHAQEIEVVEKLRAYVASGRMDHAPTYIQTMTEIVLRQAEEAIDAKERVRPELLKAISQLVQEPAASDIGSELVDAQ